MSEVSQSQTHTELNPSSLSKGAASCLLSSNDNLVLLLNKTHLLVGRDSLNQGIGAINYTDKKFKFKIDM